MSPVAIEVDILFGGFEGTWGTLSFIMKAKNVSNSKAIKKLINATKPLKYVEIAVTYNITTSGTIVNINLPGVQGTGNGQRTGDEIEVDRIEIREYLIAGDSVGNSIRAIFFQNKGSAVISSAGSLLTNDYAGYPGITSLYQSFIDKTGIKVFSDKTYVMIPQGSNNIVVTRHSHMLPIKRIAFNSGASTPENGQIQVLLISDSFITPNPSWTANVRVYYRDA